MTTPPVISFQNVTKRFPGVVALRDVSMDIVAGELHAVVGENGAGKSTLVKCLSGVIIDYEGTLLLRGEPIRFRSTTEAERAGISIIHQELNLVEQLSAAANVFLAWCTIRISEAVTVEGRARTRTWKPPFSNSNEGLDDIFAFIDEEEFYSG